MYRQSEKNLLSSNISSVCLYNMVNFGPVMAEIDWRVWDTPSYFNGYRVLVSLLQRRCSTEVNQTLHDVWPSPGLLHYIYTFEGFCPLTQFCHVQKFTLRPSLAFMHGTPPMGVSRTLRHGTRNGKTELSQRAPPIFGRAAIMLGIGPQRPHILVFFL